MNTLLKIFAAIVLFFIFLQIPILKIKTADSVNPVYYYDSKKKESLSSSLKLPNHDFIFHMPVSKVFTASHQYDIVKLDKNGNSSLSFRMPLEKNVTKDRSTAYLLGKDGFITYPENGSFFLWYPRLGNHTFFYDQEGQFLWSHRTSHYMKAFPSGKYILSMTGDHSRAFYMMPDLSVIGSSEGTLLINYEFSTVPNSEKSMQICLGFLDGDVVFYNPALKQEVRIGTGSVTKSISCDFEKMYVAVQMENPDKSSPVDVLALAAINGADKKSKIEWKFITALPQRYTETLPMGLTKEYGAILLPEKNSTQMLAFDFSGRILNKYSIRPDSPIEDWRISHAGRNIIAWNSTGLYLFNPQKVYEKRTTIDNVTVEDNEIFIESPDGILALQLSE